MNRQFILLLTLCLTACATTNPEAPPEASGLNLAWPAAPEPSRIEFVNSFRTPQDLGLHESFSRKLKKVLAGGDDRHMSRPYAIALSHSMVAVADPGAAEVHLYNTKNKTYRKLDRVGKIKLRSPIGLAFVGDKLAIADSGLHKVFMLDRRFKLLRTIEGFQRPTSLTYDPIGQRLYAADTLAHTVLVFDQDGEPLFRIGERGKHDGQFNFPSHLAFADDHLLVTDTMNFRIQSFSSEGNHLSTFGKHGDGSGHFAQPKGVAVDSDGHIYVVDALKNQVQIFSKQGVFLLAFGGSGTQLGTFQIPTGIAVLEDLIYVADSYNQRVQVFRYLPREH